MDFMHQRGIAHLDIKLDNIVCQKSEDQTEYEIKIADFGLSTFIQPGQKLKFIVGTPGYAAPELLREQGYD